VNEQLFRLEDRKKGLHCLAPTHEEVITALAKDEIKSHKDLPLLLYQIGRHSNIFHLIEQMSEVACQAPSFATKYDRDLVCFEDASL